jgi:hypothetical protein
MSWQATAWAAEQACGGPTGKLLLYAIANYADERGECWPSDARLAADTELSTRSIQSWKQKVAELGLAEIEPRGHREGRAAFDVIRLRLGERPEGFSGGRSAGGEGERPEEFSGGPGADLAERPESGAERPESGAAHKEEPSGTDSPPTPPGGTNDETGDREGEPRSIHSKPPITFDDVRRAWGPDDRADWAKADLAFHRLGPEMRDLAAKALAAYRAKTRAARERSWSPATALKPGNVQEWARLADEQPARVEIAVFGKIWWWLFWRGLGGETGEDGRFEPARMLAASRTSWGAKMAVIRAGEMPGETGLAAMVQLRGDGEACRAWLGHAEAGAAGCAGRWPAGLAGMWIWTPAEWPPDHDRAAAEPAAAGSGR